MTSPHKGVIPSEIFPVISIVSPSLKFTQLLSMKFNTWRTIAMNNWSGGGASTPVIRGITPFRGLTQDSPTAITKWDDALSDNFHLFLLLSLGQHFRSPNPKVGSFIQQRFADQNLQTLQRLGHHDGLSETGFGTLKLRETAPNPVGVR